MAEMEHFGPTFIQGSPEGRRRPSVAEWISFVALDEDGIGTDPAFVASRGCVPFETADP